MSVIRFPVIDPVATGANICRLRKDRGLTVRDLQLPMNEIIISTSHIVPFEQQASACCSGHFILVLLPAQWAWQNFKTA